MSSKLSDGKSIGGKGRLTDRMIDLITTYYGNAIRQNKTCLSDMRKAVWAVYFHVRSSDEEPLHSFCPVGPNSWCKYQNQVVEGSVETFRHSNKLPVAVMDAIKPVFNDLSQPKLLQKYLGLLEPTLGVIRTCKRLDKEEYRFLMSSVLHSARDSPVDAPDLRYFGVLESNTLPCSKHIRLVKGLVTFLAKKRRNARYDRNSCSLACKFDHLMFDKDIFAVAMVAEWYRYRIVAGLVTSSIPVPLKTRRVGVRCLLNLSRAPTCSRGVG
ncbi:uncharacterized protein TNCV_649121 [Trichonephila clavipes]|nr:uncharacterized protein TNCV_649121 [Trichonephila clavipes]